jgi:hypothetical protein
VSIPYVHISSWCVLTSAWYRKTHLLKLAPLLEKIAGAKDRAERATLVVRQILDLKLEPWKNPIDQRRESIAPTKQPRKRTPTTLNNGKSNKKQKCQQVGKAVPLTAGTNGLRPSLLSEVTMDTHRKYSESQTSLALADYRLRLPRFDKSKST